MLSENFTLLYNTLLSTILAFSHQFINLPELQFSPLTVRGPPQKNQTWFRLQNHHQHHYLRQHHFWRIHFTLLTTIQQLLPTWKPQLLLPPPPSQVFSALSVLLPYQSNLLPSLPRRPSLPPQQRPPLAQQEMP